MPLYVYEAKNSAQACDKCREGFEISQSLKDDKLTRCPDCGNEIYRVIQAPGLTHSKTDLHYRAKRAGFKCLKKVEKGEYEKIY
ncbi:MAG: zinc ribbon domain-containing protein [Kiritimatiellae bacterium]|nr:zinc ribbon domain-containing protein [Kiritimatiellia bacterium]